MKNASYIGISVPSEQIESLRTELPLLENKIPDNLHLTLDYLGEENLKIYGDRIISQFKNECVDILEQKVIFSQTSFIQDRYSEDIIYILTCNDTSKSLLNRIYDSMNIPELHSNFSSKDWTPHITITRTKKVNTRKYPEKKLIQPIELHLSSTKFL